MNDGEDEEEEREELQEEVEEADKTGADPGRILGDQEGEGEADTEPDENDPDCAEFLHTLDSPGSSGHPGGEERGRGRAAGQISDINIHQPSGERIGISTHQLYNFSFVFILHSVKGKINWSKISADEILGSIKRGFSPNKSKVH